MSDLVRMPRYRCLDLTVLSHDDYSVVPVRREDMLPIMAWRNAQLGVLRQRSPLTAARQAEYWTRVVEPAFELDRPPQLLLSYLYQGNAIGYGGLVHISWDDARAEVSFLVDPLRAAQPGIYARDFSVWLRLMRQIAFERLGFRRLFTETYDIRPQHITILEAAGFEREGRLRCHVTIDGQPVDSLIHGCLSPHAVSAA